MRRDETCWDLREGYFLAAECEEYVRLEDGMGWC